MHCLPAERGREVTVKINDTLAMGKITQITAILKNEQEKFEEAIQNEKKVFDFGIFTENGEPNFVLARFKENFGASGIFRDTLGLNLTE